MDKRYATSPTMTFNSHIHIRVAPSSKAPDGSCVLTQAWPNFLLALFASYEMQVAWIFSDAVAAFNSSLAMSIPTSRSLMKIVRLMKHLHPALLLLSDMALELCDSRI